MIREKTDERRWRAGDAAQYARCLMPLASLCVVFTVYAIVYNTLIACPPCTEGCEPIPDIGNALEARLGELSGSSGERRLIGFPGRIAWTISIGLSLLLSLMAFFWATYLAAQVRRYDGRPHWHSAWPPIVALVIWYLLKIQTSAGGENESPWRQFAHSALRGEFAGVLEWTRFFDMTGFFLAAYIALALSLYLCCSVRYRPAWQRDFPRHERLVNATLYLGALLLVAGVLRISSLLYWSLDYVAVAPTSGSEVQQPILSALGRIADGIVNSRGLLYTMMLAALYVPAVLFLQHQVRAAAAQGEISATEEQAWTQRASLAENLLRFLAVAGPAISGPAAEYLELFQ